MIIIGYPGIGKTTLAKNNTRYIDLESTAFHFRYAFRTEVGGHYASAYHVTITANESYEASNSVYESLAEPIQLENTDWEETYANVALHLSKTHDVFVSSHPTVVKYFQKLIDLGVLSKHDVWVITPVYELKRQWVDKLIHRAELTGDPKHMRAYDRARRHYMGDVEHLMNGSEVLLEPNVYFIEEMDYDLESIINELREESNLKKFKELSNANKEEE